MHHVETDIKLRVKLNHLILKNDPAVDM